MPNIIVGAMLFIASLSMFSFSTLYGAIDRTFNGLDEVVLREGIDAITLEKPFFDKELTYRYIFDYFSTNLNAYKNEVKYYLDITFEKEFIEESIYYPTQIDIWFMARFGGYRYTNEVVFRIVEGEMYLYE